MENAPPIFDHPASAEWLTTAFRRFFSRYGVPMVLVGTPEGVVCEVNDRFERLSGRSRDELIGRPLAAAGVGVAVGEIPGVARGDGQTETTLTPAAGERSEWTVRIAGWGEGGLYSLAFAPTPADSVRRHARQFRDLFEFAPDATVLVDQEGLITQANRRTVEIFGYEVAELLGRPVEVLVPESLRAAHRSQRLVYEQAPVPRAMGARRRGLKARRKSGEVFPVEISLAPIETEAGRMIAAAIRDVTAQFQADEARAAAERHLQQRHKLESLGTLAGGIAHDFNNILTGMLGFVELAQHSLPADHEARLWLRHTNDAGLRARGLVQQILTFGRRQESELAPLRLQRLVEEALELFRSTLRPGIQLRVELQPDSPAVAADSSQMYQVLVNLCSNAMQALPAEGGCIRVSVTALCLNDEEAARRAGMPLGDVVRLSVEDDGCGMSPETIERIFDPFYTTKAPGKGTGLGLAVVDGIVRSHRGAIAVDSAPGRGSAFHVYLPALPGAPTEPPDVKSVAIPRGHGEKVIVVDDQSESRMAIAGMIRHLGYTVLEHAHAKTALEEFAAAPPEFAAIVTDYAMPGLTGRDLVRAALALGPGMPVIVVSGYLEPGEQEQLTQLGARDILRKPVTLEELATALAAVVPRRGC